MRKELNKMKETSTNGWMDEWMDIWMNVQINEKAASRPTEKHDRQINEVRLLTLFSHGMVILSYIESNGCLLKRCCNLLNIHSHELLFQIN